MWLPHPESNGDPVLRKDVPCPLGHGGTCRGGSATLRRAGDFGLARRATARGGGCRRQATRGARVAKPRVYSRRYVLADVPSHKAAPELPFESGLVVFPLQAPPPAARRHACRGILFCFHGVGVRRCQPCVTRRGTIRRVARPPGSGWVRGLSSPTARFSPAAVPRTHSVPRSSCGHGRSRVRRSPWCQPGHSCVRFSFQGSLGGCVPRDGGGRVVRVRCRVRHRRGRRTRYLRSRLSGRPSSTHLR